MRNGHAFTHRKYRQNGLKVFQENQESLPLIIDEEKKKVEAGGGGGGGPLRASSWYNLCIRVNRVHANKTIDIATAVTLPYNKVKDGDDLPRPIIVSMY